MFRPIYEGFLASSQKFPERRALHVDGRSFSYAELREDALRLAATVQRDLPAPEPPLTAIFAYRSPTAFAGWLGALLSGHGIVPLNPTFPVERLRLMLKLSGCRSVIVDQGSAALIQSVVETIPERLLIVFPDIGDVSEIKRSLPGHTVLGARDLARVDDWRRADPSPDEIAYVLFTSGSTGTPKGVMIAHRNQNAYVDYMVARLGITEHDRFSQMFEMTFDVSFFDLLVAWERGACVCCPNKKVMLMPGGFINEQKLTVWYSTPSTAILMKRLGALKPGSYPSLRWSLFAGEPLPVEVADAWAKAAPNSIVENHYGPTELTVTCVQYRYDPGASAGVCELGTVPIGYPSPGMTALVVDRELREVAPGAEGELLVTGPQVSPGYWRDPERTAAAFVKPPGRAEIFYRTGDRVRRPLDSRPMCYLGRIDFQVKVMGHRVELGEIEAVLREESGLDGVVAMGWPLSEAGAGGVVAFLEGSQPDGIGRLSTRVAERLPAYMVPRKFMFMERMPVNSNGKYDRHVLRQILEAQT